MRKYTCKDTKEVVYGYANYLRTKHWKNTKTRMYNSKYKYECYCCGFKHGLQLHHKSYKTVGNENLNHLIWLCGSCHKKTHDLVNKNNNLWSAARKIRKHSPKTY